MPILTLLPLIFAALKVIMEIVSYLQEHPQLAAETKAMLGTAYKGLEASQGHFEAISNTIPQGNNIEAP